MHRTGALDLDHLASLVDARTKLINTGPQLSAQTRSPGPRHRGGEWLPQPDGERRST
jgi:hypothetical protein